MRLPTFLVILAASALAGSTPSGGGSDALAPGARVRLHAHNCYPQKGLWRDRLDRALGTGARPIVIEQDVVWRSGESVVAHEIESAAAAPTLEQHFFARVGPMLDRALADGRPGDWPVAVLHLDFKTHEPEHHADVWRLLGKYERWLTTAERVADPARVTPLAAGPLLVLTERGTGQEVAFHDRVPVGAKLRIFGTVAPLPPPAGREKDPAAAASMPVEALIPTGATNYRRWTNHSWAAIEAGGPPAAGEWTPRDRERLHAVVKRAHDNGLWIRFYTLNGHGADANRGWSNSYNFGSLDAARARWRAAIEARVDFVATDQYEEFASELSAGEQRVRQELLDSRGTWHVARRTWHAARRTSHVAPSCAPPGASLLTSTVWIESGGMKR